MQLQVPLNTFSDQAAFFEFFFFFKYTFILVSQVNIWIPAGYFPLLFPLSNEIK